LPGISHQTDEQLELYAMGRLPGSEVAVLEEHLLVCIPCQERLDEVEGFAIAMRQAIAMEPAVKERNRWFLWLRPQLMWAPAFAAIVLTIVLYLHPARSLPPLASLNLASMRGDVPQVALAQETDLTLTDAPSQPGIRAEVVDSTGIRVWSGQLGDGRQVKIATQLAPGSYFVRLFDPPGKLLHEYGFNVRATRL
jgi:hypothetical protein